MPFQSLPQRQLLLVILGQVRHVGRRWFGGSAMIFRASHAPRLTGFDSRPLDSPARKTGLESRPPRFLLSCRIATKPKPLSGDHSTRE
ncbi:MAG: hypothetical protein Ct9H300mP1_16470 [Planctomycetaceae bacterium]|nr:MAG: hypothetical protein Ct9H300mP1_16470 [Planctomycetaceae bacterium]